MRTWREGRRQIGKLGHLSDKTGFHSFPSFVWTFWHTELRKPKWFANCLFVNISVFWHILTTCVPGFVKCSIGSNLNYQIQTNHTKFKKGKWIYKNWWQLSGGTNWRLFENSILASSGPTRMFRDSLYLILLWSNSAPEIELHILWSFCYN